MSIVENIGKCLLASTVLAIASLCPMIVSAQEVLTEKQIIAAGGKRWDADAVARIVGNTTYYVAVIAQPGVAKGNVWATYYPDERTRISKSQAGIVPSNFWFDKNLNKICFEQRIANKVNVCYAVYDVNGQHYSCIENTGVCPYVMRI